MYVCVCVELFQVSNFYLLFHAFGLDISFTACLALAPLTILLANLPIGILGLGVREFCVVVLFAGHGPQDALLAAGLAISVINELLPTLAGLVLTKRFLSGM